MIELHPNIDEVRRDKIDFKTLHAEGRLSVVFMRELKNSLLKICEHLRINYDKFVSTQMGRGYTDALLEGRCSLQQWHQTLELITELRIAFV